MQKIYSSPDTLLINHLKNILEIHGIACLLTNVYAQGAMGKLPPDQVWPQLWIMDAAQAAQAQTLIQEQLRTAPRGNAWHCPQCYELIEGQFTECWQCGASKAAET